MALMTSKIVVKIMLMQGCHDRSWIGAVREVEGAGHAGIRPALTEI